MLEMKHITKRFPGIVALNDVSLSLKRGEVHALVGENGAGKSTLMKILSGVYQADEGELLIDGAAVHPTRTRESEKLGINIIFQEFSLVPDLNAFENIFLGREIRTKLGTLDRRTMRRMAREALDRLAKKPLLTTLLRLMRAPAHLAGLGDLHEFLESGFDAFRHMGDAHEFLDIIETRERRVLENLFSGAARPFA